jgi:hypothetical protein
MQQFAKQRLKFHVGGRGLPRPNVKKQKKIMQFLKGNRNGVIIQVKLDAQADELSTGRRQVAGGDARFDAKELK